MERQPKLTFSFMLARRGEWRVGVEVRGVWRSARASLGLTDGTGDSFLAQVSTSASCAPRVSTVTSSMVVVVVVMTFSAFCSINCFWRSARTFLEGRPGLFLVGDLFWAGLLGRPGLLPRLPRPRLLDLPRLCERRPLLLDRLIKSFLLC